MREEKKGKGNKRIVFLVCKREKKELKNFMWGDVQKEEKWGKQIALYYYALGCAPQRSLVRVSLGVTYSRQSLKSILVHVVSKVLYPFMISQCARKLVSTSRVKKKKVVESYMKNHEHMCKCIDY